MNMKCQDIFFLKNTINKNSAKGYVAPHKFMKSAVHETKVEIKNTDT